MGVSEIRSNLIKLLSSIDDERLLHAVYNFLENRKNSEEGRMWLELTDEQREEVLRAYEKSEDDANLIPWEEVMAKHLKDTEKTLIKKTIISLTRLPDQKLKAVSDFAEFLLNQIENQALTDGIQKLVSNSKSYEFLEIEEDLYTVKDLKERYR